MSERDIQELILNELEKLNNKMDEVFRRTIVLETQRVQSKDTRERLDKEIAILEERVDLLEKWRWKIMGATMAFGASGGAGVSWLMDILG